MGGALVGVVAVLGTPAGFASLPTLVVGVVVGVAVYGAVVVVTRVREVDQVVSRLRGRFTR